MTFITHLYKSLLAMILFTLILGFCYPLMITGLGEILFSKQVNGSLITDNNNIIGSSLIGQNFQNPKYFFSRPSAAPNYNALNSGGSNLSPTDPQLTAAIESRIKILKADDPGQMQLIPIDLVTSSGSGLDPDISVAAAYYQAPRIANLRHLSLQQVNQLIESHIEPKQLGFLGEPRVNVLELNIALDQIKR